MWRDEPASGIDAWNAMKSAGIGGARIVDSFSDGEVLVVSAIPTQAYDESRRPKQLLRAWLGKLTDAAVVNGGRVQSNQQLLADTAAQDAARIVTAQAAPRIAERRSAAGAGTVAACAAHQDLRGRAAAAASRKISPMAIEDSGTASTGGSL
jgi:hypothetical protein